MSNKERRISHGRDKLAQEGVNDGLTTSPLALRIDKAKDSLEILVPAG